MNATLAMMEKWEQENQRFEAGVLFALTRNGVHIDSTDDLDLSDPGTALGLAVIKNAVRWKIANKPQKKASKIYTKQVRDPNGTTQISVPLTADDWKGPAQKLQAKIGMPPLWFSEAGEIAKKEMLFDMANNSMSQHFFIVYDTSSGGEIFPEHVACQHKGTLYTREEWEELNEQV